MYATMEGYRIGWPMGADKLLLVSVGTGLDDRALKSMPTAAGGALRGLLALMGDCAALQEILLQWMSSSPTARAIDREVGNLRNDVLGGSPLLAYLRYQLDLSPETVNRLKPGLDESMIDSLTQMDAPENMSVLEELGALVAQSAVDGNDFPLVFDVT